MLTNYVSVFFDAYFRPQVRIFLPVGHAEFLSFVTLIMSSVLLCLIPPFGIAGFHHLAGVYCHD